MARKEKNIGLRQVRKMSTQPHKIVFIKIMARDILAKLIENVQQ